LRYILIRTYVPHQKTDGFAPVLSGMAAGLRKPWEHYYIGKSIKKDRRYEQSA